MYVMSQEQISALQTKIFHFCFYVVRTGVKQREMTAFFEGNT